uniref:Uncharacterized protein n=1 Tax=Acrobeloides nanus TaxID=290746 RepID=A0A914D874_9BILA
MDDGIYRLSEELRPPSSPRNEEAFLEIPTSIDSDKSVHKDNGNSSSLPPAAEEISKNLSEVERWLENRPESSQARNLEENGFENV